jgi:crotonobetainyl-CoA:carnitine CoA-transferase CaiB-like acyl-CoA transferase
MLPRALALAARRHAAPPTAARAFASVPADDAGAPPLAGVRVLDVGQVVAGNFAGALLAYFGEREGGQEKRRGKRKGGGTLIFSSRKTRSSLSPFPGADVIKIEPPTGGDPLRSLRHLDATGTSLWWRGYGRNRRCVGADLRTEGGRGVVKRLAAASDVLIENFTPGRMESWGLGPADLSPRLVYVRISGRGQTGPSARLPGYASVCEAESGFRAVNGYPDRPPVRPNVSLGDSLAGLHAAFGAVLALRARDRDRGGAGAGQTVDAAITEAMLNIMEAAPSEWADAGVEREPSGSTISGVVPSGTFATADGRYVVVGGNGDSVYTRLMAAVGRPDMGAANPAYATNAARVAAADAIYGVLAAWIKARTLDDVVAAMNDARVPAGPIARVSDVVASPQAAARGLFERHAPGGGGGGPAATLPTLAPRLTRTPGRTTWAGPALGAHTDEVLAEAGYGEDEVARLREEGSIV